MLIQGVEIMDDSAVIVERDDDSTVEFSLRGSK